MTRTERLWLRVLLVYRQASFEANSSWTVFLFGFWLLIPFSSDTFYSPVWQVAASYAPEWVWGLTAITLFVFSWVALLKRSLAGRRAVQGLCFFYFMLIVAVTAQVNITTTGVPIYAYIALRHAIAYVRMHELL